MIFDVGSGVVVGLMVGVEFAVAVFVNPILNRLSLEASMAARSDGARFLGKVMPVWYSASLALMIGYAVSTWHRPSAAPALGSAVLLAASVVLSLLLLVPINSRSASWKPETAPPDWREQTSRWDRFHYLRVAIIVLAFVCAAWALARGDR